MSLNLKESFDSIKSATLGDFKLSQVGSWIQKHTKLAGKPVSFVNREYQERILQSEAPTLVVKKCSQVGLSELIIRRNLALCDIIDGFKIIHTLPAAMFASKVTQTRIDPIIEGSRRLTNNLHRGTDSSSIKRFGNSHLYITGTYTVNDVISTPADLISVDELDFSDIDNVENLQSRLTASDYRWWSYISTPTLPDFGIDAKYSVSKRHENFCKCKHCNMWYSPDYLKHARIPGFSGELLSVTDKDLASIRWQEAQYYCPHCGKPADLSANHRSWVCENPDDNFLSDGFQISPTDAPNIISAADLVLWSTGFKRKANFVNYHLGQVMLDAASGLNETDIIVMQEVGKQSLTGYTVFGLDLGTTCHLIVSKSSGMGRMTVTHKYTIDYKVLEDELLRLIKIHRPTAIVSDTQPYIETVHRLQQKIPNLFGAMYINGNGLEPFRVIEKKSDETKSVLEQRQVNINRSVAFNILMDDIRESKIGLAFGVTDDTLTEHLTDMKRKARSEGTRGAVSDDSETLEYRWVKTKGNDHFHHALLYCHIASQMTQHRNISGGGLGCLMGSFRLTNS